jgi:hypothetical protein
MEPHRANCRFVTSFVVFQHTGLVTPPTKLLNFAGLPDLSLSKDSKHVPTPLGSTQYTKSGYVSMSNFADQQCSDAVYTTGVTANTCFIDQGFAYIFRLVHGIINCNCDYSAQLTYRVTFCITQTTASTVSLSTIMTRSARCMPATAPYRRWPPLPVHILASAGT